MGAGFHARPEDDNSALIAEALSQKMPEWDALDYISTELIDEMTNYERGNRLYGVMHWREDVLTAPNMYCHGVSVEVFREY